MRETFKKRTCGIRLVVKHKNQEIELRVNGVKDAAVALCGANYAQRAFDTIRVYWEDNFETVRCIEQHPEFVDSASWKTAYEAMLAEIKRLSSY